MDNSICATVTPLYNPWQFGDVMRCPLPLYIDERSYIVGKTEDIPLSMIVGRVDPPHGRIITLNNCTNVFEALSAEVSLILL